MTVMMIDEEMPPHLIEPGYIRSLEKMCVNKMCNYVLSLPSGGQTGGWQSYMGYTHFPGIFAQERLQILTITLTKIKRIMIFLYLDEFELECLVLLWYFIGFIIYHAKAKIYNFSINIITHIALCPLLYTWAHRRPGLVSVTVIDR